MRTDLLSKQNERRSPKMWGFAGWQYPNHLFFFTPPKPKDKNVSLKIYIDTSD